MRFLTSIFLLVTLSGAASALALRPLTNEMVLEDLNQLVKNVQAYYGPLEYKSSKLGFKLDDAVTLAEKQIRAAKSEAEAISALAKFLGKLGDGHVSIQFPNYTSNTSQYSIPIFVTPVEGKAIVATVDPSITNLGIEVGDELVSVDGEPTMTFADKVSAYRSFGNPKSNAHLIYQALRRDSYMVELTPKRAEATLIVAKANGKKLTVNAVWRPRALHDADVKFVASKDPSASYLFRGVRDFNDAAGAASLQAMGASEPFYYTAQAREKFRITRIHANADFLAKFKVDPLKVPDVFAAMLKYENKNILVLRMPTYSLPEGQWQPYIQLYKAILNQYEPFADVLVVDQTHNPGGNSNYLEAFLQLFIKERAASVVQFMRADRKWIRHYEAMAAQADPKLESERSRQLMLRARMIETSQDKGEFLTKEPIPLNWDSELDPNQDYTWKKPMLVLIDELAGSCGDIFPMVIKRNNIAKLFGEATMGLGGNVEPIGELTHTGASVNLTRGLFAVYRADGKYADADLAENNGQKPDYPHSISLNDFRAGLVGYVEAFAKAAVEQLPK